MKMKKIKLMNKIAAVGTDVFDKREYDVGEGVESPDAVLVRSSVIKDGDINPELLAIARAGAGVNNIPIDKCAASGVVVFNTPGANANAVKELAVLAIILASRNVIGGVEWAKTLAGSDDVAKAVEGGKSKFAGTEVLGKTLGVIGLGAIGGLVANSARGLGMNVIGCDPFITVNAAWSISSAVKHAQNYDEIYAEADYITLHVPSNKDTRGMICKETIAKMKDGVRIINLARADLVNADDMVEALESGKVAAYVTDFPTEKTLFAKNTVNIPHLGASTAESEDNCAVMAARQLVAFIEHGNIKNSVNYPSASIAPGTLPRVSVAHKNIANMLSQITSVISAEGINIENLSNGSRGDYAYTLIELGAPLSDAATEKLQAIDGVIKVRRITPKI